MVTDPCGEPLDVPLDTTSPVAWVGYANAALAARIGPVLAELVDDLDHAVARPAASTCSVASPTTRVRWCSRCRPAAPRPWSRSRPTRSPWGRCSSLPTRPRRLAHLPYPEIRDALAPLPRWTHYVVGVAAGAGPPRRDRTAAGPPLGVVGGAAVGGRGVERGAGGRDRACARRRRYRPAPAGRRCARRRRTRWSVRPAGSWTRSPSPMGVPARCCRSCAGPPRCVPWPCCPTAIEVVGWPTGAEHDVGGAPYRRARAAAFMGKRIVEDDAAQDVAVGERAARVRGRRASRSARRRGVPRSLGRHRRRHHDRRPRRDVSGAGGHAVRRRGARAWRGGARRARREATSPRWVR